MLLPFLKTGGVLMVPVLVLSVLGLTLVLERGFFWLLSLWRQDGPLRRELRVLHVNEKRASRTKDRVAQVLYRYVAEPEDPASAEEEAREVIRDGRRGLGILNMIASVATSFGLLGTVVGVSASFSAVAESNSRELAAGLSVALNTTVAGLIVFLFSFICWTLFDLLSRRQSAYLEESLQLMQRRAETGE